MPKPKRKPRNKSWSPLAPLNCNRAVPIAYEQEEEEDLWFIGTFVEGSSSLVEWAFYPQEKAVAVSKKCVRSSVAHVVWNSEGTFEFVCSGSSKSDVAALLSAHEQEGGHCSSTTITRINRPKVDDQVEQGLAPRVPPYSSPAAQLALLRVMQLLFHRRSVSYFSAGPLRMTSICHFDLPQSAPSAVALTLDDAPCRFRNSNNSRMPEVLELLQKYNAKATFMVIQSFVKGHEADLVRALQEGHQLANHGVYDESFKNASRAEFSQAVDQCNQTIQELQEQANTATTKTTINTPLFFRAPHAYYTQEMEDVLTQKGMRNVMCNAYASCPVVQDSDQIGKLLLRQAQSGGILLIHMPERGFRDWTLPVLEIVLKGLQERGIRVVTLSQLEAMSVVSERNL